MPSRLPPDFDPHWYAVTYRDVSLSGLSPSEHYRRFGILLGRPAKGEVKPEPVKPAADAEPSAEAAIPPAPEMPPPIAPSQSTAPAKIKASAPPLMPKTTKKAPSIIDRPAGFDPLAGVPKP